nr:DNA/RNA non-specific endonuclease [Nostoc sp. CHAB 5715]
MNTPGSGLAGVTTSTRVIAVNIPNTQGVRTANWRNYRVSVDSLESLTGYNFLSQVSTSIQSVIEARVDNL